MKVPLTIGDFLRRGAVVYAGRTAVLDEPGTQGSLGALTYRQLDRRAAGMALALDDLGVEHSATEAELIGHCRARLAHFKCPTSVETRDELPRTATGKLQKFRLRGPYWQGYERRIN